MNVFRNKYYVIVFLLITILIAIFVIKSKLLDKKQKVKIENAIIDSIPNNSTSFLYDFETTTDLSNINCIVEEKANSGKKSSKVDSANPYSTTINKKISEIKCNIIKKVIYGAWVYVTESNPEASLVFSIKDTINNKEILWTDISLNKMSLIPNKWIYLEKTVDISPEQLKNGHVVNLYLWNRGKSTIYIDDILVDFCRKPSNLSKSFIVSDFNPLTNYNIDTLGHKTTSQKQNKLIYIDFKSSDNGFVIPSATQLADNGFIFQFKIKNISDKPQNFYYKIYYQNESYKFSERDDRCEENFYGSWADVNKKFATSESINNDGQFHTISDTFTITSNPRNEAKYYFNGKNDKWKRNPRMGNYSFLLVVVTEETLNKIPDCMGDISLRDQDKFVNPYLYFLSNDGKKLKNIAVVQSENYLKLVAQPAIIQSENNFEVYSGKVPSTEKFSNTPEIADILTENYSLSSYQSTQNTHLKEKMIHTLPKWAAGSENAVEFNNNVIVIKNPKSTSGNLKKQNVGVISRFGFTYGKHTVKVRLTKLLNKNNMWNGITNIVELINQTGNQNNEQPWNTRRVCFKNDGYRIPYKNKTRANIIDFSKISFEILKSVSFCSDGIVSDKTSIVDNKVMVSCVNWDLACYNLNEFNSGCRTITYQGKDITTHRWRDNFGAINQKTSALDNELFGQKYYYFQIEWLPTEIIWRMGADKNNLQVIGYMNESITSIPNNQMLMKISQNFQNTKWLPEVIYQQGFIPFPKNEIKGEVYEYTIE